MPIMTWPSSAKLHYFIYVNLGVVYKSLFLVKYETSNSNFILFTLNRSHQMESSPFLMRLEMRVESELSFNAEHEATLNWGIFKIIKAENNFTRGLHFK